MESERRTLRMDLSDAGWPLRKHHSPQDTRVFEMINALYSNVADHVDELREAVKGINIALDLGASKRFMDLCDLTVPYMATPGGEIEYLTIRELCKRYQVAMTNLGGAKAELNAARMECKTLREQIDHRVSYKSIEALLQQLAVAIKNDGGRFYLDPTLGRTEATVWFLRRGFRVVEAEAPPAASPEARERAIDCLRSVQLPGEWLQHQSKEPDAESFGACLLPETAEKFAKALSDAGLLRTPESAGRGDVPDEDWMVRVLADAHAETPNPEQGTLGYYRPWAKFICKALTARQRDAGGEEGGG